MCQIITNLAFTYLLQQMARSSPRHSLNWPNSCLKKYSINSTPQSINAMTLSIRMICIHRLYVCPLLPPSNDLQPSVAICFGLSALNLPDLDFLAHHSHRRWTLSNQNITKRRQLSKPNHLSSSSY
jgi:hypothetical protein